MVNPPETAITFHPASLRVWHASRAPVIIGKESATCLQVSKSIPFRSSTLLIRPSSQFIEPWIPFFVISQISFSLLTFSARIGRYYASYNTPSTSKIASIIFYFDKKSSSYKSWNKTIRAVIASNKSALMEFLIWLTN